MWPPCPLCCWSRLWGSAAVPFWAIWWWWWTMKTDIPAAAWSRVGYSRRVVAAGEVNAAYGYSNGLVYINPAAASEGETSGGGPPLRIPPGWGVAVGIRGVRMIGCPAGVGERICGMVMAWAGIIRGDSVENKGSRSSKKSQTDKVSSFRKSITFFWSISKFTVLTAIQSCQIHLA